MPNRYTREGINSSRSVASLDPAAEVFYRRMLLVIDDFGRYEVDYLLIRSAAYPVHNYIRETDIARWMAACQKAGLLAFYESGGRRYMVFTKTEPPRAKCSRYPDPPPDLVERLSLFTSANICPYVKTNAPNTNTNANTKKRESNARADEDHEPLSEIPPMSREDFDVLCELRGIPKDCSEWFWNTHDARNWTDATGQPIRKVEPILMNALANWRIKQSQKSNANDRNANHCTTGPDRNAGTYNAHYDIEAAKRRIR